MKGNLMNRKNVLSFLAALVTALALSSAAALLLREYDRRADNIVPLTEGQVISFPQVGFSLTVPPGAEIIENETADGALFAASIVMQDGYLRFAAYKNATGERIEALDAQQLVTQYTRAGAKDVRLRTLPNRVFIEYAILTNAPDARRYMLFETWDERVQLVFETELSARDVLPILATITN